jgi:glucokinase
MQKLEEILKPDGTGLAVKEAAIGVDIGGTKVAAGLVSGDGKISRQRRALMPVSGTAADGLTVVMSVIDPLLVDSEIKASIRGIGICSPGPLDPSTGVIINPPNVPYWRNYPLAAEVAKIYQVPVKVDNDANAAALGETLWGAGQGYRNVFLAIIGTGIGTGIVMDGQVYHGRTGAGGEGGHMSIDYHGPRCGCGKLGCIEVLASGPAIARRARAKIASGTARSSCILEIAHGNIDAVTSEMVGQAYTTGDPVANEILLETIHLLTLWLGNIVDLLEPDILIMGGGVSSMLTPLFDEIRNCLPSYCVNSRCQEIPLVSAFYGEEAGIAGGAALCSAALIQM